MNVVRAVPRPVVARTRGHVAHGGIVRLVSPSALGELIKPFVFLDSFDCNPAQTRRFGWQPHSGTATVTVVFEGTIGIEETTGWKGTLGAGGIGCIRAGRGAWRASKIEGQHPVTGFQFCVALGPELETSPAESYYLNEADVPSEGPARLILGRYGRTASPILTTSGVNCLDVRLDAGDRWTYQTPAGHTVAWIAVLEGAVSTPELVTWGTLAVFAEGSTAISMKPLLKSRVVLGSAVRHPHALVLDGYSVHTNADALAKGKAEIQRIRPGRSS
jgi:redox-sensitive bicupin YhaK (pirin superfamily)